MSTAAAKDSGSPSTGRKKESGSANMNGRSGKSGDHHAECELCQKEAAVGKCQECNKSLGTVCANMHPKIPVCASHVIIYYSDVVSDKRKRLEDFLKICRDELAAAETVKNSVAAAQTKLEEKERAIQANLESAESDAMHKVKTHFDQQKERLHIIVCSSKNTIDRKAEEAEAFMKVTNKRKNHIEEILKDEKQLLDCDVEHHAIRRSGITPSSETEHVNISVKHDEGVAPNKHFISLPMVHAFENARAQVSEVVPVGDQAFLTTLAKKKLYKLSEIEIGQNARKVEFFQNKSWVLTENGLQVFSASGKLEKTIEVDVMKFAKSITFTTDGDIVLVTRQGLAQYDMEGHGVTSINEGAYSDVSSSNNYVYALEHRRCELHVFKKMKHGKWSLKNTVELTFKSGHVKDTVLARGETVCVCSFTQNAIYRYEIPTFALIGQVNLKAGSRIHQPWLNWIDSAGSVLVSDLTSGHVMVIDRSGTSAEMRVEGLEVPTDAGVDESKGHLWVISAEMESWRMIGYGEK